MHIGLGMGVTTRRLAGTIATIPGTMSAPVLAQVDQTHLQVTRAAAPGNGGSPITSYDLRFSTDQVSWTTVTGIAAVQSLSGLAAGTLYYVQTRALNAVGAGGWSASASLATVIAAPVNLVLPVISGTAQQGQTLSVTNGTWSNAPTGYAYQWTRAGTAILGATAATYLLVSADVGSTLTCTVTASNAGGSSPATSAATSAIVIAAPTNAGLPAISGTTQQGNVLTTTNGTWTNSPASFAYQWNRLGTPISGAVAGSYVLQAADVGATLTCTVTAINAGGSAAATSAATATIVIAAPVNSVLPVISGTTQQGQTLSVTTGTWSNSPTGFAYQWNRAGTAISGATAATYLLISADVGTALTCTVTATNAGGSAAATSAATATIAASASVPAAMTAPTVAQATRTSILVTRAAAPADGGSAITSYDLRYSTDQATWTTLTGIGTPQTVSGLLDGTVYYVQTRAVNAIGVAAWGVSGLVATDANVTAINAEGWSAAYTSPPTFDPVNAPKVIVASRQGYDGTATAVSLLDEITITQRVRLPYPNQATLDSSRVALSNYLYATDTVSGVTNNSAEVSPKPIANWALPANTVVGNTIRLEVVAFHRNGRNREQVACVEFRATDGTTTVTQKVATSVISGRAGDANPVIVYQCDLDVSTLANPATITVNAKVYPFVGATASVLDSASSAVEREFSPRTYLRNTALAAAPVYTYVATTGNDTTGAVSTTAATAAAAPCLTILGAINRLIAVNGSLDGCIIRVGSGSFVMASTATTRAQTAGELIITRDPAVAQSAAIVTFGAAAFRPRMGAAGGWLRFYDITVQRTGTLTLTGEAASLLHLTFDQCTYDNGSNNATIYNLSHGSWIGTTLINAANASFAGAGTYEHRMWRGVTLTAAATSPEGWLALGSTFTSIDGLAFGTRSATGGIQAFNKLIKVGTAIGSVNIAGTADVSQFAFVQNVVEYISATVNPAIRVSADAATGNTQHILIQHNSFTGFYSNGRANIFYDEGATRRVNKLMSVRGNIHTQINNKSDVFHGVNEAGADASSAVGNWAYMYGVGCIGEFSQFIDANNGGVGTSFAQAYPGLGAKLGTSNTVRQDPLYTAYAGTTSGPTAGAGGGTYTLQAGSPAKAMVAKPTLRFDLAGVARSATAASAGAYE